MSDGGQRFWVSHSEELFACFIKLNRCLPYGPPVPLSGIDLGEIKTEDRKNGMCVRTIMVTLLIELKQNEPR